jgi:hypothetical protein
VVAGSDGVVWGVVVMTLVALIVWIRSWGCYGYDVVCNGDRLEAFKLD